MAFDAVKNEYEHSFHRLEKLDNKIYILLTVCAFFFVLLTDLIKEIGDISFPKTKVELALIIIFSILMFLSVALFILMLVWLIKLIKGIKLTRMDASEIVAHNMASANENQVAGFIIMRYEQCRESHNALIEDRFKAFNKCVTLLAVNAIVLLVLAFIRNFVCRRKKMDNENKNITQVLSSDELWKKAGSGLSASRAELGLPEGQNKKTGVVSLSFELNHDNNTGKSDK